MESTRNPNSKFRDFLKNQGFYVVLVICLVIIGAAVAILTLPGDGQTAEQTPQDEESVQTGGSQDETLTNILTIPSDAPMVAVLPTAAPTLTPAPTSAPTATPKTRTTSAKTKAAPPVSGEIVWGYAVDQLIYSKTLDQWMTHDAVDLKAAVGTEVKCVLAGTVQKVLEDDLLGYTVIVEHSNDRTTMYANLGADIPVKQGDKVNAGDVLGTVGTSAISECAEEPHLHFAFYVGSKPVDPADYVRIG